MASIFSEGCALHWKKIRLAVLAALLVVCACADSTCGGCVSRLPAPFPEEPRVYDGAQVRVTQSGMLFIQNHLSELIASVLENGLNFEFAPTPFDYFLYHGTICAASCQVQAEIHQPVLSLIEPNAIHLDALINIDTVATLDSNMALGHCDFPIHLRNKPISVQVALWVDPVTSFFTFDVSEIEVIILESEYEIQCPGWYNPLLLFLKGTITSILNDRLREEINGSVDELITQSVCLPCSFYGSGCTADSSCAEDGYCRRLSGDCAIRPQGLAGVLDLGEKMHGVDPSNKSRMNLIVSPGQQNSVWDEPFVRRSGVEMRVIGGTEAYENDCVPPPRPEQIAPGGNAPSMEFDNVVPRLGVPYMVGGALADMYLDHFLFHIWKSGFFCMNLSSDTFSLINTKTISFILPSVDLLAEGMGLPVRIEIRAQEPANVQIGKGSFNPDGSVEEPILYFFLPGLRMDFWMKLQGRWVLFLSLTQDVRVDMAIQFTADNHLIPILGENSVEVSNVRLGTYELLKESPQEIMQLVPRLIGIALPYFAESLKGMQVPALQNFFLEIKSLQGDRKRWGTQFYEFISVYADLRYTPPPPTVETHARILGEFDDGVEIEIEGVNLEAQARFDDGFWTPFQRGGIIRLKGAPFPGSHRIEVRARKIGDYRTLDETPFSAWFNVAKESSLIKKKPTERQFSNKQVLKFNRSSASP
jgi:hypothetical protein